MMLHWKTGSWGEEEPHATLQGAQMRTHCIHAWQSWALAEKQSCSTRDFNLEPHEWALWQEFGVMGA